MYRNVRQCQRSIPIARRPVSQFAIQVTTTPIAPPHVQQAHNPIAVQNASLFTLVRSYQNVTVHALPMLHLSTQPTLESIIFACTAALLRESVEEAVAIPVHPPRANAILRKNEDALLPHFVTGRGVLCLKHEYEVMKKILVNGETSPPSQRG